MNPSPAAMFERLREARRWRRLEVRTAANLRPPPPRSFGAFGSGSVIVPPARILSASCIFIGDDVQLLEHAFLSVYPAIPDVTPRLTIGSGTRIGRMAHVACVGEIEIGSSVLVAERVFIGDTYHGYEDPTRPIIGQPMATPQKVTIGDGAFVGVGAIVLRGVTIGEGGYVGAGAVVADDVPPRTVVVGNPARPVRAFDEGSGQWQNLVPPSI